MEKMRNNHQVRCIISGIVLEYYRPLVLVALLPAAESGEEAGRQMFGISFLDPSSRERYRHTFSFRLILSTYIQRASYFSYQFLYFLPPFLRSSCRLFPPPTHRPSPGCRPSHCSPSFLLATNLRAGFRSVPISSLRTRRTGSTNRLPSTASQLSSTDTP